MAPVARRACASYNVRMSHEGFDFIGESAAKGRAIENDFRMDLEDLGRKYHAVQERISGLQERLEEGNKHTLEVEHPAIKKIGLELGGQIASELQKLIDEKGRLEKRIKDAGGNPRDYTVQ